MITELQRQVEAHKARELRLGKLAKPVPVYRECEFVNIVSVPFKPEDPEVYWRGLWCGDLVFRLPMPGTHGFHMPTVKRIQDAVCKYFNIHVDELISRRRDAAIVEARDIAILLCRKIALRTSTEIGRRFVRDHSSILSACRRSEHRIKFNPTFAAHYNAVRIRL